MSRCALEKLTDLCDKQKLDWNLNCRFESEPDRRYFVYVPALAIVEGGASAYEAAARTHERIST